MPPARERSQVDEEQARLLTEAFKVVEAQAFYMKRCIDQDKLMDALKHASNMICELRTALLTPLSYYELYIAVCDELRYLEMHLMDLHRKGKRVGDLYELVQYAGNILPRLYLMVTVGSVYIRTKEAPARDILHDMVEMLKGVQHPTRGLFLRNYLSQMTKDKLPDVGSEYEGEGGTVDDSIEFILQNFTEMNKLWVRMNSVRVNRRGGEGGIQSRRERDRTQLRQLVATNLERLSMLDGVTLDKYVNVVLPRVLQQIVSCRDPLAQQHLMESLVQAFPDESHLHSLDKLLSAVGQLHPNVDVQKIIAGLVNRLAKFGLNSPESVPDSIDMFAVFSTHIADVIRARPDMAIEDVFMLQVALLNLSLQCYPDAVDNVDGILEFCVDTLEEREIQTLEDNAPCTKQTVALLNIPVDTYQNILTVLSLEHYAELVEFLGLTTRKLVAVYIVNNVLKCGTKLSSAEEVAEFLDVISPLVMDQDDDGSDDGGDAADDEDFRDEQTLVARAINLFRSADRDTQFEILVTARKHFGRGGEKRIGHTLVPLVFAAIHLGDRYRIAGQEAPKKKKVKKPKEGSSDSSSSDSDSDSEDEPDWEEKGQTVMRFTHQTIDALTDHSPAMALRLFLEACKVADKSGFERFAMEFVSQACQVYEEHISDSDEQLKCLTLIIGTVNVLTCLSEDNLEIIVTKVALYSSRLLKVPDRCRAVFQCSHLFWSSVVSSDGYNRDAKRVLECLQRSLRIADLNMQTSVSVSLFVDILDQYLFFFEQENEAVTVKYLNGLIQLVNTNMGNLDAGEATEPIRRHLANTLAHVQRKKAAKGPGADFSEVVIG